MYPPSQAVTVGAAYQSPDVAFALPAPPHLAKARSYQTSRDAVDRSLVALGSCFHRYCLIDVNRWHPTREEHRSVKRPPLTAYNERRWLNAFRDASTLKLPITGSFDIVRLHWPTRLTRL